MKKKYFDIFNYGSLGIVVVLLILMLTEAVPKESFMYLLVFALILLVVRIVLRIYYINKSKNLKKE